MNNWLRPIVSILDDLSNWLWLSIHFSQCKVAIIKLLSILEALRVPRGLISWLFQGLQWMVLKIWLRHFYLMACWLRLQFEVFQVGLKMIEFRGTFVAFADLHVFYLLVFHSLLVEHVCFFHCRLKSTMHISFSFLSSLKFIQKLRLYTFKRLHRIMFLLKVTVHDLLSRTVIKWANTHLFGYFILSFFQLSFFLELDHLSFLLLFHYFFIFELILELCIQYLFLIRVLTLSL